MAFGSAKASPGVTTSVLALAVGWRPDRAVVIVEADPDGGSLAARLGLAPTPGLTTLAAATRHRVDAGVANDHAQRFTDSVGVVVGPSAAEQAHSALQATAKLIQALREIPDTEVLIDCGRLGPDSPSLALAAQADALLMLARPRLEEVQHLIHRVPVAREVNVSIGLLLVGDDPYPPQEVRDVVGIPVVGVLPDDRHAALALARGRIPHRSALARAASSTAHRLLELFGPVPDVSGSDRSHTAGDNTGVLA